jgi:3-oxoacyl-(acyl-carrier-protein) synthase
MKTPYPTPIYITAAGQISMQPPLCDDWWSQPLSYDTPYVRSLDPDFKPYMTPGEARRLGKLLKRALATAMHTLQAAGVEQPDAIITGTGLGSVESTEAFLNDLVEQGEQMLKPTHFMQSTHNTIGSLIAIHTATHGYNNTYAHLGLSFESALLDATLQLSLGNIGNALVGAHDGITPSYFTLLQRSGYVGQPGMVPCGETAVEMMLRADISTPAEAWAELLGLKVMHRPTAEQLAEALQSLLHDADLTPADIDAVLLGLNGDAKHDAAYTRLLPSWLWSAHHTQLHYKHLFGESYTAAALGVYAAATALRRGEVPEVLLRHPAPAEAKSLHNILVAHIYDDGRGASLILLGTPCGR